MPEDRALELEQRLRAVQDQIGTAAAASGRSADDVTLVVITKTWPTSDIRILYGLGVRDVGENRHQDAEAKAGELGDLDLTWHFVGQIQSNKAARIATYADVVHSVDSVRVARRLGAAAHEHGRVVSCFVQVNLDDEERRGSRGGATADEVDKVAAAVEDAEGLVLHGVMGVAPLRGDADEAYRRLASTRSRLLEAYPTATALSAGMSGDFVAAVTAGATHVRVGSAVLGQRPALR